MLELRTEVGSFVGYTVGGKTYCILEDEKNQVFDGRDVLMEENPTKVEASAVGSSDAPRLTADNDGGRDGATEGAMDMLDAERGREDEYAPDDTSDSDDEIGPPSLAEHCEGDVQDCSDGSTLAGGQGPAICDSAAPWPRRSKRQPAPKVAWWEKKRKAYLASGTKSAAESIAS